MISARRRQRSIGVGVATAITLAGALALGPAPAAAQDPRVLERRVDSLFAAFEQGISPGLAVAVIRDGQVVFRKGYGYADIEHRVRITPSTVFDAASVSKQFTGLAVSMLIDQGKIRVDDSVRKFIPELQPIPHTITIGNLLHHTSGIRDWPGMLSLAGLRMDDVISFDQILRFAYGQRTLNFVPGSEQTYSNTNYNLLAEVIQRITGRTFRTYTDETIFRPLGMSSSHFRDDIGEVIPNRAYGYARAADSSWRVVGNGLLAQGSSSLFTTVDDLAKWAANFGTRAVGGNAAIERMLAPTTLTSGASNRYGFGVVTREWRGLPLIDHDGSWASFTSFVAYFPTIRGGVVMLSNARINAEPASLSVAEIFFKKSLAPASSRPADGAAPSPVDVDSAVLNAFAGVYRLGPGWYLQVRHSRTGLEVQATDEAAFTTVALSPREFRVAAYRGASITFERDSAGNVTGLFYQGIRAPRLDAAGAHPGKLAEYAGDYENTEIQTAYKVSVQDSTLVLRNFRTGPLILTPAFAGDFRGSGLIASVAFERNAAGQVTGFIANMGQRNRDVRFTRLAPPIAERQRAEDERLRNDWADLRHFRAANDSLRSAAPSERRVVFMGNSIVEGWAPLFSQLFPGKPYVGRGISGQTTPQMLARFRQDVIALHPAVVVLLAGTNDIAGNTGPSSLEMIEDNIASMTELARANGIGVVLVSVLPVFDYPWRKGLEPAPKIVALNVWLKSYAARAGAVYADVHSAMADERQGMRAELARDGVHPTASGYGVMAPIVERAIAAAQPKGRT